MIELEHYVSDPAKPGYLKFAREATYREVADQCETALKHAGLWDDLDYFGTDSCEPSETPWPRSRWVAVYAVPGNSEGHYIHVDAIGRGASADAEFDRKLVILGKTFCGLDAALAVVAVLTKAFHGYETDSPT